MAIDRGIEAGIHDGARNRVMRRSSHLTSISDARPVDLREEIDLATSTPVRNSRLPASSELQSEDGGYGGLVPVPTETPLALSTATSSRNGLEIIGL